MNNEVTFTRPVSETASAGRLAPPWKATLPDGTRRLATAAEISALDAVKITTAGWFPEVTAKDCTVMIMAPVGLNGALVPHSESRTALISDTLAVYCLGGLVHRNNDRSAVETLTGSQDKGQPTRAWFQGGKLHREDDKPAVLGFDGTKLWYQGGVLRRDLGRPAVETVCRLMWTNDEGEARWELLTNSKWLPGAPRRVEAFLGFLKLKVDPTVNGDMEGLIYRVRAGGVLLEVDEIRNQFRVLTISAVPVGGWQSIENLGWVMWMIENAVELFPELSMAMTCANHYTSRNVASAIAPRRRGPSF